MQPHTKQWTVLGSVCKWSLLLFITVGQTVGMAVVNETVIAVSPWERLGSDSQMCVGDKRVSPVFLDVFAMFFFFGVGIVGRQQDTGYGYEQGDSLPRNGRS